MTRFFNASSFRLAILVQVFLLAVPAFALEAQQPAGKADDTAQVIEFLIQAVADSQLTFIRNGEAHSSVEAAGHIRRKYDYYKSRIESPEDFIRLCASKSLISGKPYLVETPQGTVTVESWLQRMLADYRRAQAGAAR